MKDADRPRRVNVAVIETHAIHITRVGRDLLLFGLAAGAYAFIGHPDLPAGLLLFLKLGAPAGCLAYLVALYLGHRLHQKAQRLASTA